MEHSIALAAPMLACYARDSWPARISFAGAFHIYIREVLNIALKATYDDRDRKWYLLAANNEERSLRWKSRR